jgi:SusD family.
MIMKFKKIVTGIACITALSACNLDYHEYANYGKDYMDKSYENVIGMVTNIYSMLDYDFGQVYAGGMLASACDEAEYAYTNNDINDFTNGAWSPANPLSNTWTSCYKAIQACNQYLEEFQGLTFDELKLNNDYEAQMFRYHNTFNEARFLRAYFYFNLVRQYGDVPLFTEMITTENVNTLTRTPAQEIFNFIETECNDLIEKLPADYTDLGILGITPAESGRATKYAALALKARAALYAAGPLFNSANDRELWKKAAKANKEVIDVCVAKGFALSKYSELWGPDNWKNKEMIFVRRYHTGSSGVNSSLLEEYNYPIGITGGKSGNCPSQNLVDAYELKATGKLWNEENSGYDPANPYEGRDPRFEMTIIKNGDTKWPNYNNNPIQTYYGGSNGEPVSGATPTGYYLKKYLDPAVDLRATSTSKSTRHSWITYRLGEFYLNYAEAVFEYLGSADATSSEFAMSARDAVNIIRNRSDVAMPELPTGLGNEVFLKKYKNERMIELAFEGHRFYDLRRWKESDKLKSITEMKLTKNTDGSINYERKTVNRTWDDKMYLFPIPQSERMKNSNLTQNPGW